MWLAGLPINNKFVIQNKVTLKRKDMKHSVKLSLAVFAIVFATLSYGAYKNDGTQAKQSSCTSKICKMQKVDKDAKSASYHGAFMPLDNIISAN